MFSEKSEKEQEEIKRLVNRLFSSNFLVKEKERVLYQSARLHRVALEAFFAGIGWEFVLDERHEYVFVLSGDSDLRRTLNRDESIWLLVLRLIYEEKRQDLSLSEFPITTVHEIKAKYAVFSLPFVNKTRLLQLIGMLDRYRLGDALDDDPSLDDCRIRLFHSFLHALDGYSVESLTAKIGTYNMGEPEEAPYEVADEAEAD